MSSDSSDNEDRKKIEEAVAPELMRCMAVTSSQAAPGIDYWVVPVIPYSFCRLCICRGFALYWPFLYVANAMTSFLQLSILAANPALFPCTGWLQVYQLPCLVLKV